jgi:two-component system response regulator RegX3
MSRNREEQGELRTPILVVEDEVSIRKGLCDVLAFHGYEPQGVERGDEGLRLARTQDFALVILDLMLPGMNGFEVCQRLRESKPRIPVLMLTARGAEEDILHGFRCGSDDYVTKPFSIAELLARVEALLRRAGGDDRGLPAPEPFAFGAWQIDPEALSARRGAESLELTRRELEILSLLMRERGRIVSRRSLLAEVWGYDSPERIETRTVDMHIAKLRKKLGVAAREGSSIETVRGEGYRYSG